MKFKVGDIVKATTDYYMFTTKRFHWYGVVDTCEDDKFSACTIYSDYSDHSDLNKDDRRYGDLSYDCFEKASIEEIATIYFMRKHGLHIGDKFDIPGIGWNPYYFNEDLKLLDKDLDIRDKAILAEVKQPVIKSVDCKPKEMTVAEIEKELGYKVKVVKG